jgi:hypothetical protein
VAFPINLVNLTGVVNPYRANMYTVIIFKLMFLVLLLPIIGGRKIMLTTIGSNEIIH